MVESPRWIENGRDDSCSLVDVPLPTPHMAAVDMRAGIRHPSLFPYLIFFTLFSLTIILLFKVDDFAAKTKTVVGHNLEPTPWHLFVPRNFDSEPIYARNSRIIQCSYLVCPYDGDDDPPRRDQAALPSVGDCPQFFGSIHSDLEPWAMNGISSAILMEAKRFAAFRVLIVGGRLYVEFYFACVQSRALFTIWGMLQLLRRYPGMVPDVDLMFDCMDKPSISRTEHASIPLPLFRYCTDSAHFDIPFPDWSFWGWQETNIRSWDVEFADIKQGSEKLNWSLKQPYAYWKGNPDVASPLRTKLLECNDIEKWGAQIVRQDWIKEAQAGYEQSKLSNQCKHRYKIYAEGYAWSVSLKYILSCDSLALIISPQYEDFFSRGLVPKENYWPVPPQNLCESIRFAVEWGNTNPSLAESIGKRGQQLMQTLNMDRVYDYMFHLLSTYSQLQTFKPSPPPDSLELCTNSILCFAEPEQQKLLETTRSFPSQIPPCILPPSSLS